MDAYIRAPKKIPLIFKLGIWIAEKKVGKKLLAARILTWYPKAALGAGVLESLVAHEEGKVTPRLLKLIRMQVSFSASCPFCIDMNSSEYSKLHITEAEIEALQGSKAIDDVKSFSEEERIALKYARALTSTPIRLDHTVLEAALRKFNEREFVVIASTIAQVNFWTRLIQGIGVPPAGFADSCSILKLENYATLKIESGEKANV